MSAHRSPCRKRAGARPSTRAFSAVEWTLALRYLRARRAQGFISVIAGFSFLGIMLGVATLIVVMSVMNGFHKELLSKIVGINGHIFVQAADQPMADWQDIVARLGKVPGVSLAIPMVEGAAGVSSPYGQSGALVRGIRQEDIVRAAGHRGQCETGIARRFRHGRRRRDRAAHGRHAEPACRRHDHDPHRERARRRRSASRRASSPIRCARSSRSACRNSTASSSICRFPRRRPSSTRTTKSPSSRCSSTIPTRSTRCARRSKPPFRTPSS